MARKIIRIPLIVDANGKWAANGYTLLERPEEEPDWGFMEDCADDEWPLVNPQRMWVTVDVPLPEIEEAVGVASPVSEGVTLRK